MARTMPKSLPTHVWRAVVTVRTPAGHERTDYYGPYCRSNDAAQRVTELQRAPDRVVTRAVVERSPLVWEPRQA